MEPSTPWNHPALQRVHVSCAGWSLYVPAAQLVAALLPTGQNVPTPHVVQLSTLVIVPFAILVVPPGQGSGADAPSVQT